MGKKLYVDQFSPDKSIAMTTNSLSVSYNLVALDRFNDSSSPVFTVGKYLCILFASQPPTLTFIDVKKAPKSVHEIINSEEFASQKSRLVGLLEMHNATYESTKDYIELVVGTPPNVTPLDEND